jgi:CHASE2 domain-containing sensor protein
MTDFRLKLKKIARGSRRLVRGVFTHPTMLSGVLVAGLVLGLRHVGGLQPLELLAYDQMMRLRSEVEQDKRLLIVAITEQDIQRQNRYPISDEVVAKLIAKLQQYQPRVIGLDIYRDVPQMPGNAELLQQLQAVNVTTVMLLGDAENGGVAAPKGVAPERIGFSDLLVDPDAVVRRNLLFARTSTESFYSFALRSSVTYLAKENQSLQVQPEFLQIGSVNFGPSITIPAATTVWTIGAIKFAQLPLQYSCPPGNTDPVAQWRGEAGMGEGQAGSNRHNGSQR